MRNVSRLNRLLAATLALVLLVGTLAYFTDRVEQQATISVVDNAILVDPNPIDPDDPTNPDPTIPGFTEPTPDVSDDLYNWWIHHNATALLNYNPGDKMDLSYSLTNEGSLAVDVRETFIITTDDDLTLTPYGTDTVPEFALVGSDGKAIPGANVTRVNAYQYKYVLPTYTLSSANEAVAGAPVTAFNHYYIAFAGASSNAFQGASCRVDSIVEVKQYSLDAAEADDWITAANTTIGYNGVDLDVVPAA